MLSVEENNRAPLQKKAPHSQQRKNAFGEGAGANSATP